MGNWREVMQELVDATEEHLWASRHFGEDDLRTRHASLRLRQASLEADKFLLQDSGSEENSAPGDFVAWPEDWPLYKQRYSASWQSACDALVGPCQCGAWHGPGEFEMRDGNLYRYGEDVTHLTRPAQDGQTQHRLSHDAGDRPPDLPNGA